MASHPNLCIRPPAPGVPFASWIYEELRSAIVDSRLKPGAPLPGTRELSRQCSVARGTVMRAFQQLECEGYVYGRVGSGTFVSSSLPEAMLLATQSSSSNRRHCTKLARLSNRARAWIQRPIVSPVFREVMVPFRANQPALDRFPAELWTRVAARRLRRASPKLLGNVDSMGYLPLRQAVADYLGSTRAINCETSQICIVSGVQQALDLVSRLVLDPGDAVWMEDPGYPGAVATFMAQNVKMVPVPVDDFGLQVSEGEKKGKSAKLVYVTPAHQYPLGSVMSMERRVALLKWAKRARSWIFEDDYDCEYRYSGNPLPALQRQDEMGIVIYAGSFSKLLFPALRLGFVVLPPYLVDAFGKLRSIVDRGSPAVEQAILADFISEGHLSRHVRSMRQLYGERRAALLDALSCKLGGLLKLGNTDGGLQAVAWLCNGMADTEAAASAANRGVEAKPISQYRLKRSTPDGLLLGFAGIDEKTIRRGAECLAQSLTARSTGHAHGSVALIE